MQLFACPACGERLWFHNLTCACGTPVAYDPDAQDYEVAAATCANREPIGCNWKAEGTSALCRSCAMTSVVPDVLLKTNLPLWAEAELAKRWVLANLARWGWLTGRDGGRRPDFELLAEETSAGPAKVTMGHADGLVTINVNEADPAVRVQRRVELGEPYRTMVGHFRHELGHFFFERLRDEAPEFHAAFRALFGDESADYGEALKRHYAKGGAEADAEHISGYATSHPHEDWAEHFAHLLHLVDLADSFVAVDLDAPSLPREVDWDAYTDDDSQRLLTAAAELGIALNHVNRAMGIADIYPFVLTPKIREKLGFIHQAMQAGPRV